MADHLALKTQVVVKFIATELAGKPEAAARFEREAAAGAQVKSPHVVQVLDHGTSAEHGPYIVMELLEGKDLGEYLKGAGRLPAREVAALISQVARALGKAHAAGIIHRDIKPDNIFLCDVEGGDTFVKLLDFGVAKTEGLAGNGTTAGQVLGTPHYMAPEQLLGQPIDARTDVWALGVVAFEALTGKRPFGGETIGALTLEVHRASPRAEGTVEGVPAGFDAWFDQACARERDARFASAKEAAQRLTEVCANAPSQEKKLFSMRPPMLSLDLSSSPDVSRDSPKTQLSSAQGVAEAPPRSSRGLAMLGVVGLAVAVGVAAVIFRPTPSAAPATADRPASVAPPPPAAAPAPAASPAAVDAGTVADKPAATVAVSTAASAAASPAPAAPPSRPAKSTRPKKQGSIDDIK